MKVVNRFVKRVFWTLGFEVLRRKSIPYGIDVMWDIERLDKAKAIRVIFDIGANTGQTAIPMAKHFPESTIFSLEPEPKAYAQLRHNVASLRQIRPYNLAAGARETTMLMHRARRSDLHTLSTCEREQAVADGIEISVTTIDHICRTEGIDQIDILKTDTEGFDVTVLEGAKDMLSRHKVRFVYSECDFVPSDRDIHTNFFSLYEYMRSLGYCFVTLYTENVTVPGRGFDWGAALFCLCEGS